ncbi:MAG: thioesterase family protein [Candidatus Rokubacteria bacterium]|nr:thioesterase family protein [Candidatus Rokubacteria bacterium]
MTTTFDGIRPGLTAELEFTVTDAMVTRHVGGSGVLTTPHMIQLMEDAAAAVTAPLLPPGHTSVGYEVAIRHRAPTAPGMRVRVRAELLEVSGRKLNFRVEARNERELIGEGTHRRTIVQVGPV